MDARRGRSAPVLLVFGKYPTPGRVKTRLAPALTPVEAARVHAACTRLVWSNVTRLGGLIDVVLICAPDDAAAAFRNLLRGCGKPDDVWPQGPGDLGARLSRGFERAFAAGYGPVIAMGTDSPLMPPSRIEEAVAVLSERGGADVCVGPTEDGGYELIGLRRPAVELFTDVAWGTERVFDETLERVRSAELRAHVLPRGFDLDRPADLTRAMDELADGGDNPLVAELKAVLRDVTLRWTGDEGPGKRER